MRRLRWGPLAFALGATCLLPGPAVAQAQSSPAGNVHVVQPGDTLSQIALDAGADPAAIAALNGLSDTNALSIGQSLKLSGPSAANTYTVAEGDTLWGIAQRFNTTPDAVVQLNHLDDPNHLVLGTVLTIPGSSGSASSAAPARATPSSTAAPAQPGAHSVLVSYTVQQGETLSGIAHQFSVSADTIAQASAVNDPNKVTAGAVLKVPLAAKQHVVSDGETLRDIAAAEKVDLGSLVDFNHLDDPELIHVGQTLLVPLPATAGQQAQQAASIGTSPSPTPTATPSPSPSPSASPKATPAPTHTAKPTATSTPAPSAKPAQAQSATPTPAPRAPIAVVKAPAGAPTDGLAGAALKFLGSAYLWGGSSPSGFDCSGFVWYLARQQGKTISRGLFAQYNAGSHPARDQLQVGDLVFFQNTFEPGLSHNGIYIGNGQFVHAADEAAGVTISSLNTPYWTSHWFGATRLSQ